MPQENNTTETKTEINIPLLNGMAAQGPLFVAAQFTNAFKTAKEQLNSLFKWLPAIYGPLSKTLISLVAITVLIENILNIKEVIDMALTEEIAAADRNKKLLRMALSILKATVIGLLTAVTFGVAGVTIMIAAIAFPVMIGLELAYGIGEIAYDKLVTLPRQERDFQEKKQAYLAIKNLDTISTQVKQFAKIDARIAHTTLSATKENLIYQQDIAQFKTVILAGAIMTLFAPTMILGFASAAIGFIGVIGNAIAQTKLSIDTTAKLQRLETQKATLLECSNNDNSLVNNHDFTSEAQIPAPMASINATEFDFTSNFGRGSPALFRASGDNSRSLLGDPDDPSDVITRGLVQSHY